MLVSRGRAVMVTGAALCAPLLWTAYWLLRHDLWGPVYDFALIEMRVADVGGSHTPLLGLPGRLGAAQDLCHPGPLAFYLLAPAYRLLGGTYGALRASTALLACFAHVSTLLVVRRNAGAKGVLVTGAVLTLLQGAFGLLVMTEPWNPHLPVPWYATFLAAAWAVMVGDHAMLPVAAAAASYCAQTHVPYAALCGGIGVATVGIALRDRGAPRPGAMALRGAVGLASVVVVVLWAPPLVEQLTAPRGNLGALLDFFAHPQQPRLGVRASALLVIDRLDVVYLVAASLRRPGVIRIPFGAVQPETWRGAIVLLVWAVGACRHWKEARRTERSLHALALIALGVSTVALSRITGPPLVYLSFGAWTSGALVPLAAVVAWSSRGAADPARRRRWRVASGALAGAYMTAVAVRLGANVADASSSVPVAAEELAVLAEATASAIEERLGATTGRNGVYFVAWDDALWDGGQALGLAMELQRRGFHAGVGSVMAPIVPAHRTVREEEATAVLWLATGGWIHPRSRRKGALPLAYVDPRTDAERAEFENAEGIIRRALIGLGKEDVAASLDLRYANAVFESMTALARAPESLDSVERLGAMRRIYEIGVPAAVFVLPGARAR